MISAQFPEEHGPRPLQALLNIVFIDCIHTCIYIYLYFVFPFFFGGVVFLHKAYLFFKIIIFILNDFIYVMVDYLKICYFIN